MSAFSRGCPLRLYLPRSIQFCYGAKSTAIRPFTTTSCLSFSTKKPNTPKSKKSPVTSTTPGKTARPSTATSIPLLKRSQLQSPNHVPSYALTLAQKPHSTLLYTAPSHTGYKIASYTTGIFCLSWSYYSINSIFLQVDNDLPTFVPWTFGLVALGMVWFGSSMLLNSRKLIHSMTAIPRPHRQLQIEIVLRKVLPVPFFPARRIYVAPEEMTIPATVAKPVRRLTQEDLRARYLEEERAKEARRAAHKYDMEHLLTSPFRHMGQAFRLAIQAVIRAFNREGFMEMRVKGQILKLDVTAGWALDGGKAIDRLAKLEPHVGKGWLGV